ncbi:hypothetical protein D3C80_2096330 [compost metagenome]
MSRGLVGNDIRHDPALDDLRINIRRIADKADRHCSLLLHRRVDHLKRRIEIGRDLI